MSTTTSIDERLLAMFADLPDDPPIESLNARLSQWAGSLNGVKPLQVQLERAKVIDILGPLGMRSPAKVVDAALETHRREPHEAPSPESREVSAEERERARQLLKHPKLLAKAAAFISQLGLRGERTNRRFVFLAGVGGLVQEFIDLIIHGGSSGGKNHLVRTVLRMFPPEFVTILTGLSARALEYRGGRIEGVLLIEEAEGQQPAEYSLRVGMSDPERRITRLTVNKSSSGGNESQELSVQLLASTITTTTAAALHAENQTRVFDLWIDESRELTRQVLTHIGERAKKGQKTTDIDPETAEELLVWQTALGMLKPLPVVIPYADRLMERFPDFPLRARRDGPRTLTLIRAHALLYQNQRDRDETGNLIATIEDYAGVYDLLQAVLEHSMSGLSERAFQLCDLHDELAEQTKFGWVRRPDLEAAAKRRKIASHNTVKKWARILTARGIWDARRNGAWEHKKLCNARSEAVPLPRPEDLEPTRPTSAYQTATGMANPRPDNELSEATRPTTSESEEE